MKNYTLLIAAFLIFLSFSNAQSQNPEWIHFTSNKVNAIVEDANFVWTGGSGLVKIKKTDGSKTYFLPSNSGLPTNAINDLAMDSNGNLWIASTKGLIKYDGENWELFNQDNSELSNSYLSCVATEDNGDIWVAGYDFISRFDGSDFENFNSGNSNFNGWKVSGLQIADGIVWAASEFGLFKYESASWSRYGTTNSNIPSDKVLSLEIDSENAVWVGAEEGLAKYNGESWETFNSDNSLLESDKITALEFNDGIVYIGSNAGLFSFDGTEWNKFNLDLPNDYINCVFVSSEGGIFVGIKNLGLAKFAGVSWSLVSTSILWQPLFNIQDIYIDNGGDAWLATWNGIARHSGEEWSYFYSSAEGKPLVKATDFAQSSEGVVYVALKDSTVARFESGEFHILDIGVPITDLSEIEISADGEIWLGSDGAGTAVYDGEDWRLFNYGNSKLPDDIIYDLKIDDEGNIWTGTRDGLGKYDGNEWFSYDMDDGLPENNVTAISFDPDGNMWIGTVIGPSKREDGEWISYFDVPEALARINSIDFENSTLWAATDLGALKFDGSEWTKFNSENSNLTDNNLLSVAIDGESNKWFGMESFGLAIYKEGGVIMNAEDAPKQIALATVYPNPFSKIARIKFHTNKTAFVDLNIFDAAGSKVANLVERTLHAGNHDFEFAGGDKPVGTYFYVLQIDDKVEFGKMIYIGE